MDEVVAIGAVIIVVVAVVCGFAYMASESAADKALRHDRLCISYGAKPGTPEYIQCRATLQFSENIKNNADAALALSAASLANSAASSGRR